MILKSDAALNNYLINVIHVNGTIQDEINKLIGFTEDHWVQFKNA
jgi:hypothetical protein